MVLRICEQLRLNGCGKNALRLKFAKQHGFAGVPSKPPLVVPRTIRGGGICEANDGEVVKPVTFKPLSRARKERAPGIPRGMMRGKSPAATAPSW